jgi:hypothetical protein
MMHGHGKSDSAIVAVKPTNKVERSAAEPVEPRAETKGNVGQQSTRWTQSRISVSKALARIRQIGKAARTDLSGGREVTRVPTATGRGVHRPLGGGAPDVQEKRGGGGWGTPDVFPQGGLWDPRGQWGPPASRP